MKSIHHTLHTIWLIRHYITTDLAKHLVTYLVLSRLDYCYSILNLLTQYTFTLLTNLQYYTTGTIFRIHQYYITHITPYFKSLHWLPIQLRIHYKILTLTHHATHHNNTDFLTGLLTNYNSSRPQRNTNKYKLLVYNCANLSTKQQIAFLISAPKLWNIIPYTIR